MKRAKILLWLHKQVMKLSRVLLDVIDRLIPDGEGYTPEPDYDDEELADFWEEEG